MESLLTAWEKLLAHPDRLLNSKMSRLVVNDTTSLSFSTDCNERNAPTQFLIFTLHFAVPPLAVPIKLYESKNMAAENVKWEKELHHKGITNKTKTRMEENFKKEHKHKKQKQWKLRKQTRGVRGPLRRIQSTKMKFVSGSFNHQISTNLG